MNNDDVKYMRNLLDKLREGQAEMNVTLARNTASLEEHVKRTNILEAKVDGVDVRLKPIENNLTGVKFVLKALAVALPLLATAKALGWL